MQIGTKVLGWGDLSHYPGQWRLLSMDVGIGFGTKFQAMPCNDRLNAVTFVPGSLVGLASE